VTEGVELRRRSKGGWCVERKKRGGKEKKRETKICLPLVENTPKTRIARQDTATWQNNCKPGERLDPKRERGRGGGGELLGIREKEDCAKRSICDNGG